MKLPLACIVSLLAVFIFSSARADQTYWTGLDIQISAMKATVSVSLTSFVDSADSGEIALVLQDENYKTLKVIDASGSEKMVRKGKQSLKLTKIVEINPGQKKIQIWTPIVPDGHNKSTKPVFREYELKQLDDGSVIPVIATQ